MNTYPVRKKGERRRLEPNQAGIEWLEEETRKDTTVCLEGPIDPGGSGEMAGLNRLIPSGWYTARRRGQYPRRMFDIFGLQTSSSGLAVYSPCRACDDFSRSWNCPDHTEVPWNAETLTWERAGETEGFAPPPGLIASLNRVEVNGETLQVAVSLSFEGRGFYDA